jgi:hypothetical protein
MNASRSARKSLLTWGATPKNPKSVEQGGGSACANGAALEGGCRSGSIPAAGSTRPRAVFDHKELIVMKRPFAAYGKIGLGEFL